MARQDKFIHRTPRTRPIGRGGQTTTYKQVGTLRGSVGLKSLTLRERSTRDSLPGRRPEKRISHVGYFRRTSSLRRGHQIEDAHGTTYEVVSRRLVSTWSLIAEFELVETQRAT